MKPSRSKSKPDPAPAPFVRHLAELMARHNIIQSDVAAAAGLDRSTLSRILNGSRRLPRRRNAHALLRAIGLNPGSTEWNEAIAIYDREQNPDDPPPETPIDIQIRIALRAIPKQHLPAVLDAITDPEVVKLLPDLVALRRR
ncbi:XRE family transcriptional regulator [Opitutaceae bacterium TAV4]|nr:XRE family transcriptional regulator [Opitutaceae bacterium TAV4]RRK02353.1 XRE family transcriptional regulator [Opitutaceae bacterium TAV3]